MRQDIALLYILQQTTTTVAHSRTIPQQHLGENWLQGKIKTLSKEIVKQIQGLWPVTGNFPSLAPLRIKICQSILLDMETVTTSSTAGSEWEGAKPHTISPLTVQQKKGEKNNITIKTNITYLYHYMSILYTVYCLKQPEWDPNWLNTSQCPNFHSPYRAIPPVPQLGHLRNIVECHNLPPVAGFSPWHYGTSRLVEWHQSVDGLSYTSGWHLYGISCRLKVFMIGADYWITTICQSFSLEHAWRLLLVAIDIHHHLYHQRRQPPHHPQNLSWSHHQHQHHHHHQQIIIQMQPHPNTNNNKKLPV